MKPCTSQRLNSIWGRKRSSLFPSKGGCVGFKANWPARHLAVPCILFLLELMFVCLLLVPTLGCACVCVCVCMCVFVCVYVCVCVCVCVCINYILVLIMVLV